MKAGKKSILNSIVSIKSCTFAGIFLKDGARIPTFGRLDCSGGTAGVAGNVLVAYLVGGRLADAPCRPLERPAFRFACRR